jgi:hypothetical protein
MFNAAPQTAAHATIRQQRDGSRPLGNSSISNTHARIIPDIINDFAIPGGEYAAWFSIYNRA